MDDDGCWRQFMLVTKKIKSSFHREIVMVSGKKTHNDMHYIFG